MAVPKHKFHRWLMSAVSFENQWRRRNNSNFDYYESEQWTEEEKAAIQARGQQATVLNMVRPTIDTVLSLEIEKRIDIQVVGRNADDDEMADILTQLLLQITEASDADYYQSQAVREGIIGGRGWTGVRVYEDDYGQTQIAQDWIPWNEVFIDPFHRKPDGSDARFIIREVWYDRDEVKEMFGNKEGFDEALFCSTFGDDYEGIEFAAQSESSDRFEYYDKSSERVKLCYCWYKDAKGGHHYVVFSDNVFFEGSEDGKNPDPYDIGMFPLVPFTCFRKRKGEPMGLVRLLVDGQDMINKLNSKYLWNMSNNRIIVENDATDDPDELRDEMNKPDGLAVVNPGGLNKIREEQHLSECQFLAQHIVLILGMMQRTSGVNDSMLGQGAVNERSATQQQNRILQGASMQTSILENIHFMKKRIAQISLRLAGKFFNDERVIRVTEANGTNNYTTINKAEADEETGEETILRDISDILRYDVILKKSLPFSSARERTMQIFSEVAKTGGIPQPMIAQVMFELSDMPNKHKYMQQAEGFAQAVPPPG